MEGRKTRDEENDTQLLEEHIKIFLSCCAGWFTKSAFLFSLTIGKNIKEKHPRDQNRNNRRR